MKLRKPTSKRVPVRLRHKIEKASSAKQRKMRKLAKKDPTWRTKLKKDPGIPNLFPYKEKLLQEIEEKRRVKDEETRRKREDAKLQRNAALSVQGDEGNMDTGDAGLDEENTDENDSDLSIDDDDAMVDDSDPMAALLASARRRAAEFEQEDENGNEMDEDEDEDGNNWEGIDDDNHESHNRPEQSRKAYDKVFKQVVEAADVVLYVLDARDPEGTRSKEVERQIMSFPNGEKRMILILNKIDLVPPPVLRGWLTHLRRYFLTLPLRATGAAANAKTFDHKDLTSKSTSDSLFKALKSYAQSKSLKRSISAGVIGYPNVGKSSVINALTARLGGRTVACPVGAEAGITTGVREVKLDNKMKLLDSPGIVFPSQASSQDAKTEEHARLILLNAIPPKEIVDPTPAVTLLISRLSSNESQLERLLSLYNIPSLYSVNGDTTTSFLVQVARARGRLGKGGVPNLHSAAMAVITDWRDGRIQGWMEPPTEPVGTDGATDTKIIVKQWAAEFKIEGLWGDDTANGDGPTQMLVEVS